MAQHTYQMRSVLLWRYIIMIRPQPFLNPSQSSCCFKALPASQELDCADFKHSFALCARTRKHFTNPHSGFTLIELMIALALGLLIVAAAIAIFLSSQRSLSLQAGMGEVQENANFGLAQVAYDLRHANLNTVSNQFIDPYSNGSGIIFTASNIPNTITTGFNATEYVTQQDKDEDNGDKNSDRLTIQYVPVTDSIYNCEGEEITEASSKVIVQRYYLAKNQKQVEGEPVAYSLMCDAGWYSLSNPAEIKGLGENAQQIMQRVDAFKVRVSTKLPNNTRRYIGLEDYVKEQKTIKDTCATTTPVTSIDECMKKYWKVIAVEVGILARSTGSIGSNSALNTGTEFNLAGTKITLDGANGKDMLNQKYLRQAVNQVVAFRNTLGAQ